MVLSSTARSWAWCLVVLASSGTGGMGDSLRDEASLLGVGKSFLLVSSL